MRAMGSFMGGFFLAFSFFKLLDLPVSHKKGQLAIKSQIGLSGGGGN